jgi:DNA-binding PadR family transcriptional regulator
MGQTPRMTIPTLSVLGALLNRPSEALYGLEIARVADLHSGTLYPILARLERAGWVESDWEAIDASETGRPRRRYYRLTGAGADHAASALKEVSRRLGVVRLQPKEGLA